MTGPHPDTLTAAIKAVEGLLASRNKRPLVIGICGAQGSGKSTLANALAARLSERGAPAAFLSIDDLYLTIAERSQLAREIHPLLATRGPPGTHDVALGCSVLAGVRDGAAQLLPRFDKAHDDRRPEWEWPRAPSECAAVILEGWCVGAMPQRPGELLEPVNALEAEQDQLGIWRTYVNDALAGQYRELFGQIDYLIFLQAPSFDVVLDWRVEQEEHLRSQSNEVDANFMDRGQIALFIQHYERITRHLLIEMPDRADLVIALDMERRPDRIVTRHDPG